MKVRVAIVLALSLASCKSKDEPAKQQPRTALFDAGPKRAPAAVTLVDVDPGVTRDVNAHVAIVIRKDGSLATVETPLDRVVTLARLDAEPVELDQLRARVDAVEDGPPPPEPDEPDAEPVRMELRDGTTDPGGGLIHPRMSDVDPQLARAQALEEARKAGILDDPCVQRPRAGLRGSFVDQPVCLGTAPLILVDAGASASRLIEVMSALPASQLGVTADGGAHARTLGVAFTFVAGQPASSADPAELVITLRPDGVAPPVNELVPGGTVRLHLDGEIAAGALVSLLAAMTAPGLTVGIGAPMELAGGAVDAGP